eukprot:jgi/Picsp_1/5629/NSC_02988-R1_duf647 family protein
MISTSARRLFVQAIKTQTDACVTNNGLVWLSGGIVDVIDHYNTLCSRFYTQSAHIITQLDGKGDSTVVVEISEKTKDIRVSKIKNDRFKTEFSNRSSEPHEIDNSASFLSSVRRNVMATFFPVGYPASISKNYMGFVSWQAVHHFAGSANSSLASAFMLYSAGMGSAAALPTAGAINWLLKDGIGQLGTLLFARFMARDFDSSTRLWYIIASLKLNLAIGMELATFVLPSSYFLPLASAANGLKGLAWMAGGATRSSFNVSFSQRGNIADITAKATSQTIFVSLLGTWVGLGLAAYIQQQVAFAGAVCVSFSLLHMYSSYKSARKVPLRSLNPSRVKVLAQHLAQSKSALPTPEDCSVLDGILADPTDIFYPTYDVSISEISSTHSEYLKLTMALFQKKKYIIVPRASQHPLVLLHKQANTSDIMEAALTISLLGKDRKVYNGFLDDIESTNLIAEDRKDEILHWLAQSMDQAGDAVDKGLMHRLAEAGWDLSTCVESSKSRVAYW